MFVPREAFVHSCKCCFCCFSSSAGDKREGEGEMARVFPIVWRISFSRRRGRVARGKPPGARPPPLSRASGRVSDWCRRGCKSRGYKQTFCCSSGREACRPAPWVSRPGAAALVSATTLVSAARGGRLEGGREREVGGELHRAGFCVLPSLHLSKAKPVFGVAWTVCVLPSSKVPPPKTLPWLSLAERTVSVCFFGCVVPPGLEGLPGCRGLRLG